LILDIFCNRFFIPPYHSWKKIDPETLKKYLEENPDAYLKEIAKEFEYSDVGILRASRRLKISRKKNDSIQGNE